MTPRSTLLDTLFEQAGIGYLSADGELQVLEASAGIERFCRHHARSLAGLGLITAFPEFEDYYGRLRQLARGEGSAPVRFRVRRADNSHVMVSATPVAEGPARVLVLFEDITLLVLRTDVLGRRVKDLESRCQYLERLIDEHRDAVVADGFQRHFDPGTGLYGLDFIITRLVDEEASARRWNRPLSVAVVRLEGLARRRRNAEIDAGTLDAALRETAGVVRRRLRSMDTVGRLDETAVVAILPNVAKEEAWVPIERIRSLLADRPLIGPDRTDVRVGIAELEPDGGDTALAVFERARQGV